MKTREEVIQGMHSGGNGFPEYLAAGQIVIAEFDKADAAKVQDAALSQQERHHLVEREQFREAMAEQKRQNIHTKWAAWAGVGISVLALAVAVLSAWYARSQALPATASVVKSQPASPPSQEPTQSSNPPTPAMRFELIAPVAPVLPSPPAEPSGGNPKPPEQQIPSPMPQQ